MERLKEARKEGRRANFIKSEPDKLYIIVYWKIRGYISAQPHTSLCMRFNVCSPLFHHQETTKTAHNPIAIALFLPLFSDLHA